MPAGHGLQPPILPGSGDANILPVEAQAVSQAMADNADACRKRG
jgi:hypothetical protein